MLRVLMQVVDPVRLSFLRALLADAGIETVIFDGAMSSTEGGIGAFPRRLMVSAEDAEAAMAVLREAGEA